VPILVPSGSGATDVSRRRRLGLGALLAATVALAGWAGSGDSLWILLAAPTAVLGLLLEGSRGRAPAIAGGLLLAGVAAVLAAELHLHRLAQGWPERTVAVEARAQERLSLALDELLERGEETAAELANLWAEGRGEGGPELPAGLRRSGVEAVAVFGPAGDLLAWDGTHQGPIPADVRAGGARYLYQEGALFGYLYVTHPIPGEGGTAMAAWLLRSDLPPVLGPRANDFEARFAQAAGAVIEVARAERAVGENIWDLRWEDEVLFSVTLHPASEGEARAQLELTWARLVMALLLLAWLLSVLGARGDPVGAAMGGAALILVVLLLPLAQVSGWAGAFSPADFLLPGPFEFTLGDVLVLGMAGILALGLLPWDRLPGLPGLPAVLGGTILATLALALLAAGASRDFLAGGEVGWVIFQGTGAALVLLSFGATLLLSGPARGGEGVRRRGPSPQLLAPVALLLALGLALGWTALVGRLPGLPTWVTVLWAIPLWAAVGGAPRGLDWSAGFLRWGLAGVLAVTMVLPWAWDLRVSARIAAAEERIERLGTRPDPFLEFLLLRLGEHARELGESETDPVELLYKAWTASELAWEGIPLWITYWSPDGTPQEELRIGVPETRPQIPASLLEEAQDSNEVLVRRFDLADAHYLGVAPLDWGALVSVIVPPRRMLAGGSPLVPLFSPARAMPDPLVLIPMLPGEVPGATEGVRWVATRDGWQGETYLAYPDEVYHAHYLLELPTWMLRLARGTLLLLLNVGVLGLVWAAGRWIGEGHPAPLRRWLGGLASFRGRVTLALFAFFLIPSILFGTLAYRTLSGAAVRTAEVLAERAAEDGAIWFSEVAGGMDVLARQIGSDLLLYENGELASGSLPELVRLGLYEGWLPPAIHRDMAGGEELMTTATSRLGGWEYVVAYRRMPGGRVLAAPAPLQAGAMALRQRDVTDLIGFSVVMGGLLSVLLSLMVGRALSRPIQTLQIASERVGAGNMGVHLPEDRSDEFGAVFDAFNRMVDRLAQTRRALLRSSRRTRAIVEEVATGVIALDRQGRVTLANPRAEQLLDTRLERGRPLPGPGDPSDPEGPRVALSTWIGDYFRDGLREGGTELSVGGRRIRVRARRIARKGPPGGAVISLEDVTDELRTERILAWGEMAQQVAHEVKNPLTPIKLGVQHIRRAWVDGHPDYEEILSRNVEAILIEIDRLAAIASSFSRFAAPSPAGLEPLERVRLDEVVGEVMDLYRAGGGPVRFEQADLGRIPPVLGRPGEVKEVLVNLLENARAALPQGGGVRVEAEEVEGQVELRVRDEGTGIPPELLPRIFEPHFSTRSTGTGLGLAIVRRLVESWGGSVSAESREGEGTVVRVRLRLGSERPDPAPAAEEVGVPELDPDPSSFPG